MSLNTEAEASAAEAWFELCGREISMKFLGDEWRLWRWSDGRHWLNVTLRNGDLSVPAAGEARALEAYLGLKRGDIHSLVTPHVAELLIREAFKQAAL